jgi:hypothetical protein
MAAITQMVQANVIGAGGVRQPYLLMFSAGLFSASLFPAAPFGVANVGAALGPTATVQMCQRNGVVLIVANNGNIYTCDLSAGVGSVVANLTVSAGAAPTGTQLCAFYRDRLILSDTKNFFASASGDYTDWDNTQDGEGASWFGNDLVGGVLGDIHLALIPQSNDNLIVACSKSLFQIVTDPAAGGTIEAISRNVGVFGPNAWCLDPAGNAYIAGPQGFWRIGAGGRGMTCLSAKKMSTFFEVIDRGQFDVQCRWDPIHKGCYIFVTRKATGSSMHLWYDDRQEAFFKWQYPTTCGPTASVVFDGTNPGDMVLLVAGRDGNVRRSEASKRTDDGTTITSYFYAGPFEPSGPMRQAKAVSLDCTLGENFTTITGGSIVNANWNLIPNFFAADDPWRAYNAPLRTKTFTAYGAPGKQNTQSCRIGGNSFWLWCNNFVNDKTWIFDRAVIKFLAAGKEDGNVGA